jgi:hypothetical protein
MEEFDKYNQTDDETLHQTHCKGYKYYPLILPKQDRIIVIGDLHGDFDMTIKVLKLAKVIDNMNEWIGKKTIVVQVGDQIDSCRPLERKCGEPEELDDILGSISSSPDQLGYNKDLPEDINILEFMNDLNKKANKKGGGVISLLGNHELMNSYGNLNNVSYKDLRKLSKDDRINAFKPKGKYAKLMACSRLPAVIVGSFIFVHAGFIEPFMKKLKIKNKNDLYKISVTLRKWLLGLIDKNYVTEIITQSNESMFWTRVLGRIPPDMSNKHPDCASLVNDVLEVFDVKGIAIGHTPQFFQHQKGINTTCDDSLLRVDFGGSFGFHKFDDKYKKDGHVIDMRDVQVLEILDDTKINILKIDK